LLGDGHAVLGDRRGAEALLEHDVAALRAQGRLDGVGEDVHAAHHARAGVFTETDLLRSHFEKLRDSLSVEWIEAQEPRRDSAQHREDVVFLHHQVLGAVQLDLGAGVLAEQHLVADLDLGGAHAAVVEHLALAHGDDRALDRLLGSRIRDHDATGGDLLLLGALDHDAVVQRLDVAHFNPSQVIDWVGKRAASLALAPGECQRPRRQAKPPTGRGHGPHVGRRRRPFKGPAGLFFRAAGPGPGAAAGCTLRPWTCTWCFAAAPTRTPPPPWPGPWWRSGWPRAPACCRGCTRYTAGRARWSRPTRCCCWPRPRPTACRT